ncbi:MAG TPA: Asp-tRNA(Asn)/Glu-tRNA(Gln) amidotransferase subunit GatA [Candidatus Saccharimonadia bacterium]|nr:Asp-tRNA(Asn)/Glu-tRNA(Gln) amidotransferase subunit GatA [Candidatus Saccharimonadia bacterium]
MAETIDLKRPIAELAAEVQAGKVSAVELVQASLDRIEATKDYHALLEVNPAALERARQVDARVAAGEKLPLAGVPFAAKDNYLTLDMHTTAASKILKPFRAPYQGPAIERLLAAGAVLVAKANLDAFAHGSSTENSDFGATKNPVDAARVPGGSSGGSAAAVALGQVAFALGTDTGGSIRLPASYCGVVGLKPTYGLVPRTGVVAMGSSTDVLGPLTNRAADAAVVLDVMAGRDASDATSIERDAQGYAPEPAKEHDLRGLKIGLIKEYLGDGLTPTVRARLDETVQQLEARGAIVEPISLPAAQLALAAYYILVPAEVSSNLARYDGVRFGYSSAAAKTLEETYRLSRQEGFGAEAKRRIIIGTYVLSSGYYDAYYKRAQKVRTKLIEEFKAAFAQYDLLLGPTAPTPAFPLGAKAHDPLAMYLNDVCTVAVNLVGAPAISLPLGRDGGLPIGLQLIAPQRAERQLFAAAAATEAVIGDWESR